MNLKKKKKLSDFKFFIFRIKHYDRCAVQVSINYLQY